MASHCVENVELSFYLFLAGHYISSVYDIKSNQWTRYDDITAKKVGCT